MECKFDNQNDGAELSARFRLTIWNVNQGRGAWHCHMAMSFRLTIWNVNIGRILI